MEENRIPPVGEDTEKLHSSDRRSLMLIISAALQWVLILVCIVYIAMLCQEHNNKVTKTAKPYVFHDYTRASSASANCTIQLKSDKNENMRVENGTLIIPSTRYYLVYLEVMGIDNKKEVEITFHFKPPGEGDAKKTTEYIQNGSVRATLLKKLFYKSQVYLTSTSCSIVEKVQLIVLPV